MIKLIKERICYEKRNKIYCLGIIILGTYSLISTIIGNFVSIIDLIFNKHYIFEVDENLYDENRYIILIILSILSLLLAIGSVCIIGKNLIDKNVVKKSTYMNASILVVLMWLMVLIFWIINYVDYNETFEILGIKVEHYAMYSIFLNQVANYTVNILIILGGLFTLNKINKVNMQLNQDSNVE